MTLSVTSELGFLLVPNTRVQCKRLRRRHFSWGLGDKYLFSCYLLAYQTSLVWFVVPGNAATKSSQLTWCCATDTHGHRAMPTSCSHYIRAQTWAWGSIKDVAKYDFLWDKIVSGGWVALMRFCGHSLWILSVLTFNLFLLTLLLLTSTAWNTSNRPETILLPSDCSGCNLRCSPM